MFSQSQIVGVYSNTFANQDCWYASPSPKLLADISRLNIYETARYIATIKGPSGEVKVAIGDPVTITTTRAKDLYVPHWLLSSIGVEGIGEELAVSFSRCEDYQSATKLSFQYLGTMPEGIDMKDLLETPLSQLGILQKGQILPAPVLEGSLVVREVQPAGSYVFLDGLEVEFDFESDTLPEPKAKAKPEPEPEPEVQTSLSGLLPASAIVPVQQTLASANRKRQLVKKVFPSKNSFVPFSGQGRTLNGN